MTFPKMVMQATSIYACMTGKVVVIIVFKKKKKMLRGLGGVVQMYDPPGSAHITYDISNY